jgi:hypothetical protein
MLTFFIVALPKRTADVIQWEFAVFFLLVLLQSVYIILQRKPKVYGIEWPPPLKDELVDAEFAR